MRGFTKRTIAVALTLLLVLTNAFVMAEVNDYSRSWAKDAIVKWMDNSVISGYTDGSFKPDNKITRAEFAKVLSTIFGLTTNQEVAFKDVVKTDWSYSYIQNVNANGIMTGANQLFRPADFITREEAAVALYRAYSVQEPTKVELTFSDKATISIWAQNAVTQMSKLGYIKGYSDNTFKALNNITRAEAITMVNNISGDLISAAGEHTGTYQNLVINTAGVTLKNATVNGDLTIAQGVGEGDVNLDNVTVKGRLIVKGGGENSIKLTNTNVQGALLIIKQNGKVRVVAIGATNVGPVQAMSGVKLEEQGLTTGQGFGNVEVMVLYPGQEVILDGDFAKVDIKADNIDVTILDGTVGELNILQGSTGIDVEIAADAVVETLNADEQVDVTGKGIIETAVVNVSGSTFETEPESIESEKEGITVVVGGETQEVGEVVTPGGGGGGGGGGGVTPLTLTSIKIHDAGGYQTATASSNTASINMMDGFAITDIEVVGNTAISGFTIKTVNGASISPIAVASNSIDMTTLFGVEDGDVYTNTLKTVFGSTLILTGTITNGSQTTNITINVDFDGVASEYYPTNEYFVFTDDPGAGDLIATIKPAYDGYALNTSNAVSIFQSIATSAINLETLVASGGSNDIVFDFGTVEFTLSDAASVFTILGSNTGKTLDDLIGRTFTVTYLGIEKTITIQ